MLLFVWSMFGRQMHATARPLPAFAFFDQANHMQQQRHIGVSCCTCKASNAAAQTVSPKFQHLAQQNAIVCHRDVCYSLWCTADLVYNCCQVLTNVYAVWGVNTVPMCNGLYRTVAVTASGLCWCCALIIMIVHLCGCHLGYPCSA